MHIPDGYLSPQTAGGLWAMMVPVWYWAGHRVRRSLSSKLAPLVAIGAAFAFVIMMFNIPVPGGTTGHATGGVLIAVVLGPWAAVISLSVALVIQALFFGDGGLMAIGANCFNIAFAAPVTGYCVYRLVAAGSSTGSSRRWLGAGIGAFAGINAAAFLTAFEVGIQGDLFTAADGAPLYSPYGLAQAIPAMMIAHLTVIGFIEAAVTSMAVAFLQRTDPALLMEGSAPASLGKEPELKPLLKGLALLLIFTPLGLLATATAWGEWSVEDLREELGSVPAGLERFAGFWGGLLPDYALPGQADGGFWSSVPGYLFSAAVGLGIVMLVSYGGVKLLARGARRSGGTGGPPEEGGRHVVAAPFPPGQPDILSREPGPALERSGSRRRVSVVERSLEGFAAVLDSSVFSGQIAERPGLLQKIDPRMKTTCLAGLLLAAGLARNAATLLALYALSLVLARASKISTGFFIKRVWLFIPLFAGIIVIPSLFNIIRPGDALLTIWDFGGEVNLGPWDLGSSLAITSQGVQGAVVFILRVAVSVSLAVLLALTTRWSDLLAALRVFRVPRVFILILNMAYRYIFLLINASADMFTARRSRMAGASTPREDRRFIASGMGTLLGKSHALSDEVYAAMISRGYTGEQKALHSYALRGADWAFAGMAAAVMAIALGGDRLAG